MKLTFLLMRWKYSVRSGLAIPLVLAVWCAVTADSDWHDQEITLVDASGFRVGDGVCLLAKDAKTGVNTY